MHALVDKMSKGTIYGMYVSDSKNIRYIGMTTQTIEDRFKGHKKAAKSGRKYPVYDWMRKHSIENIKTIELEYCEDNLEKREMFWIQYYNSLGLKLLNLTEGGSGPNGHVWSDEQRRKHSETMKEIVNRPEVKEKIKKNRTIRYGAIHSEEQKEKWSIMRKGTITGDKNPNYGKFGPDHPSYGRKLSEASKKRLSILRAGEGNPNYGKSISEETKLKMSLAQKGIPKPSSVKNAHTRHHTNKNIIKESCQWCQQLKIKTDNNI